ncbi:MAG: hypothetical protein H9872_00970 [Candidatus Cellulosilyticum pullistercoris]|uniref:Cell division protein FtsL n=1 Tax=Candidatus Cellulosilyticum pullistercoris TaxID=2838521 RepID=A0A9E2KAR5_9FIRM|nr:hypothetical protein [Candidatus Cellulosilyticum pullistercoris]
MAEQGKNKYNYQYESTARAYIEPLEPLKVPTPSETKRKTKVAPKKKADLVFGMQMTVCGVILFVCSMLYINSYATLRTKQSELNDLKNEKIAVANAITKVEADITKKLDLEYIKQKAIDELGMRKPLAHQIVYIQLPEKSYTSYN